jgi:DNA-binding FadR family transcriptional regulator
VLVVSVLGAGDFRVGDRLPPTARTARVFQVGAPTVRQALSKLETLQIVEIRHGSGV